ncbi:uncharacterized protein [Venturia canescens]|uniref:uncharacterized protein n=1 Tax=Venturia canescens TaxID=32260 RepID=UPI001C9CA540|nr:uncharacterized protein LOC122406621 [Venturia canescens]XP_043269968.1 uncharacterized protein LOC122407676 [Venturia canescens]XP_043276894.1 uncharacterized protein LOC122411879 [Venturia canescens]XP_043279926.1 uncharacterized protein LOC122413559 [Venturia canescens]
MSRVAAAISSCPRLGGTNPLNPTEGCEDFATDSGHRPNEKTRETNDDETLRRYDDQDDTDFGAHREPRLTNLNYDRGYPQRYNDNGYQRPLDRNVEFRQPSRHLDTDIILSRMEAIHRDLSKQISNMERTVMNKITALEGRFEKYEHLQRSRNIVEYPQKPRCLPVRGVRELEALEGFTKENKDQIIQYLGSLSSGSIHERAHLIIKEAISDEFSTVVTVQGGARNSCRLEGTALYKAMYVAVCKNIPPDDRPSRRTFIDALTAALRASKQRHRRTVGNDKTDHQQPELAI